MRDRRCEIVSRNGRLQRPCSGANLDRPRHLSQTAFRKKHGVSFTDRRGFPAVSKGPAETEKSQIPGGDAKDPNFASFLSE